MTYVKPRLLAPKISASLLALAVFASAGAWAAAPTGTIFDPNGAGYTSLGTQSFTSGTLTFDTTNFTLTSSVSGLVGSGLADSSASGNVQMAVFNFDSLSISSGVTVIVTGNLGLALTSRTDLTLGATISLNGGTGSSGTTTPQAGGAGAPGSEGGVRNSGVPASAPPSSTAGHGGAGVTVASGAGAGDTGVGLGGGSGGTSPGGPASNGGGGGSYGGLGGTGQMANTTGTGGTGGNTYGNTALDDLFGGSGGGGGLKQSSSAGGGGGGAGGSLALVAEGTIFVSGQLSAKGGTGGIINSGTGNPTAGGGGSGGGLLLAASTIDLSGSLDVTGGNGGFRNGDGNDRAGGGGGGGRIALYYDTLTGTSPTIGTNVLLAGGTTQIATVGGTGTFFQGTAPAYLSVPEPGTGIALLGGAGMLLGIRRRRRG